MSKIERVEISIDRVIAYLDCGCVKKSEIAFDAERLAKAKMDNKRSEFCSKHDTFQSRQIYCCHRCHIVGFIDVQQGDKPELLTASIYEDHKKRSHLCRGKDTLYAIDSFSYNTREFVEKSNVVPSWAKEAMIDILGLKEKEERMP